MGKAWLGINRIKNRETCQIADPDPQNKANKLIEKYAKISSLSSLNDESITMLNESYHDKINLINSMIKQSDICDVPIFEIELDAALTKGKSTSGEDGITYDVIRLLRNIPGDPLLCLYRMIYEEGVLPQSWTSSLIIPIPKANSIGEYRPISLTSCLCKTFERIILNRLRYRTEQLMSPYLCGFMPGKCVQDGITTFLTMQRDSGFTVFLDLKCAFDIANRQIILHELAKLCVGGYLLRWINAYFKNRKSAVVFQGCKSEFKEMVLGTPQGGVVSPFLFNILMNALINKFRRKTDCTIISYADDILIHVKSYQEIYSALGSISSLCNELGLIISTDKTKIYSHHVKDRNKIFYLDRNRIEQVASYKYLGVKMPHTTEDVDYLNQRCKTRLSALRAVAGNNTTSGANIRIARLMYVGYIRPLIYYAAPALITQSSSSIRKLELMQNMAMRIIMGCPRTTKILNMRNELGLLSIRDRITEINP